MEVIDFRSDTVSWPTPAMREAMAEARVGDDVYGEDPTVNELESTAAERLGKEAALFVTSGTQGNLTALMTHASRGDEAIVGRDAHTFSSEAGGMAVLGGIVPCPLPTDAIGRLDVAQIEAAVKPDDPHYPRTRLICTENSSGGNNGAAIPAGYFAALRAVADRHGLAVHLDGARLFNATTALGIDPREITQHVDSVSFCLSKGLCAPVGSVLVGSAEFIRAARRNRKILGGSLRQAGVLAAAGLIALCEMTQRLDEDHRHAKMLAEGLARLPGIEIDPGVVQTNMVFFRLADDVPLSSEEVVQKLWDAYGIKLGGGYHGGRGFRAVTHYWVGAKEVKALLEALENIVH